MASEELRFIASYDDVIQFCSTDEKLCKRFKDIFAESQGRVTSFDPILCAASNVETLTSKHDIWTNSKNKSSKRGFGKFDASKYSRFFIKSMEAHLKDPENVPSLNRSGFDAYAYLMAYEEDILALYKSKEDLSKLQKAALHFVEVGNEEKELDYFKYIASYDDLVLGTISGNPGKEWLEWIPETGKLHYESCGQNEILSGIRPVTDFFDPTTYIASYPSVADSFKNEDGSIDDISSTVAYIVIGSQNGFSRNLFNHNVFLANYPEVIEDDIYVNREISPVKVAKIWLERFKEGVDLSKFDVLDYKETLGIDDATEAFNSFVQTKVADYHKFLKKQKSFTYRVGKKLCVVPNFSSFRSKPTPEHVPEP